MKEEHFDLSWIIKGDLATINMHKLPRDIVNQVIKQSKKDVKDKLEKELFDIDVTSSTDWKEFWKRQLGESENEHKKKTRE